MWQRAYKNLHHEIVGGCGSPLLTKIFRELGDRLERYFNLFADRSMDLERDTHAEHRAIVDALVAGDAEKLHALLERFFEFGDPMRATVIDALRRHQDGRSQPLPAEALEAKRLRAGV